MSNLDRVKIPKQNTEEQITNFDEIILGYTKEQAKEEAERCINCKHKPCTVVCPANVPIPEFIQFLAQGDFENAYLKMRESSVLSSVCGRVCPWENQCEKVCVRGIKGEPIAIGHLESYVADMFLDLEIPKNKLDKKIAIIGSGAAAIGCAETLAILGYDVNIFEKRKFAGGVLMYGIPSFRLPKHIVAKHISRLEDLGVKINLKFEILDPKRLLDDGYDAVFIATGACFETKLGIKGEEFATKATDFLTNANLDTSNTYGKNKKIAVIGGGNVAMDCARCAKHLGAEDVYVIYRRTQEQMPARKVEIDHTFEEGINFKFLTNPIQILADENGKVKSLQCMDMKLSNQDDSGRLSVVEIENSEFFIDVDQIIIAAGTKPIIFDGIEKNDNGGINICENYETNIAGIFAGGDVVTTPKTIVAAMKAGINSANSIHEYLLKK